MASVRARRSPGRRVGIPRRSPGVALLAGVTAALFLAAAQAPTAGAAVARTVTVTYTGQYSSSFVYNRSQPSVWQATSEVSWSETRTGVIQPDGRVIYRAPTDLKVTGSITSTYGPPNTQRSCTGTLSAAPPGNPPREGVLIIASSATALIPTSGKTIQSSGPPGSDCRGPAAGGLLNFGDPGPAFGQIAARAVAPTCTWRSRPRSCHQTFTADGMTTDPAANGNQDSASLRAQFMVTVEGGSPATPAPGATKVRQAAKDAARAALRETLTGATYPCLVATTGTVLLAAGPAGLAVGPLLLGVAGPLCVTYIRALSDYSKAANDPPLDGIDRAPIVARPRPVPGLAACRPNAAVSRAVCTRLTAGLRTLLAAARATASVAAALAVGVGRLTAALDAGNRRAEKVQTIALRRLLVRLRADRARQSRVGRTVRRALAAAGAKLTLTTTQDAAGLTAVERALAARGVSASELAGLDPAGVRPAARDAFVGFAAA